MAAALCLQKATELGEIYFQKHGLKCACCEGTGEITLNLSTFGSDKTLTIDKVPCFECNGKGEYPKKKIPIKYMWCKCEKCEDTFYANDGRKVFGDDIYLCRGCGMVTQFGYLHKFLIN